MSLSRTLAAIDNLHALMREGAISADQQYGNAWEARARLGNLVEIKPEIRDATNYISWAIEFCMDMRERDLLVIAAILLAIVCRIVDEVISNFRGVAESGGKDARIEGTDAGKV